ncbi:MAG TPA: TonB-dependent receptor [Gemmatimonadales bacterium]|nr:TonB-dependent receptor [Gemmatimonadales bacterium]
MSNTPRYRALLSGLAVLAGVLGLSAQASAQAVFRGKVTSEKSGEPLVGATVGIGELQLSVLTNAQGQYVVTVPAARVSGQQVSVTARAIGYKSVARIVPNLAAGERTVDFALVPDINRLEEIIVTGTLEGTERIKVPFAVGRLTTEDLPIPSSDPLRTLAGKVPGLRIASTTGRPGTAPEILLRGPTSIDGSGRGQEPLIIVDGVIASHVGSIQELGGLDIESVEVVKGAAGSSLYGTQAAHGVITIKTKRGATGADGVKFNARSEVGFSDFNSVDYGIPINHPLQLDETGKRFCVIAVSGSQSCSRTFDLNQEMLRIHNVNADTIRVGQNPLLATLSLNDLRNITQSQIFPGKYYNSLAQVSQRHPTSLTAMDATGKLGTVGFFVSGQYTDDPGAVKFFKGSSQRRGRLNLDYNARSDLRFQLSTMFDNFYRDSRTGGIFGTILRGQLPGVNLLARDTLGRLMVSRQNFRPTDNGNSFPLYDGENSINDLTTNRFIGSAGAKYYPAPWVTVEANFGYDNRATNSNSIVKKGSRTYVDISARTNSGRQTIATSRDESLNLSLATTFRKKLATDLNARLRLSTGYDQEKFISSQGSGEVFLVKEVYQLSNTSTNFSNTSSGLVIKQASGAAAATVDYKDRYVLDGSFRYDGSSLFGPGNRWAPFNRIAGVWIVSHEPFWRLGFMDEFRLRASRGTAGNTPRFEAQYEVFNVDQTGIRTGQAGNAALKPETTTEYEVGTDFTLFKRIGIEATYATNSTRDQILPVNIPASVGYSSQWQNAGTLQNKTWELAVTLPVLNSKNFYWQVRGAWDRTRTYISQLDVPDFTTGGGTVQGTGNFFYMTADRRRSCLPGETGHLPGEPGFNPGEARPNCTGPQLNRYGNIYGRVFFKSCSQLQADLRSRCGEGRDFQVNDEGWLVWVGAGNSWRDGITKNLWQTRLPASQSPWGYELAWGHPIVDRPLAGQPGQNVGINQIIGNVFPDYRFSISNDFSWKKFTLYGLLDATIGNSINNQGEGWGLLSVSSAHFDQAGKTVETAKPVGYSWRAGSPESTGTGGFYDVLGPNNYVVEKGSFAKFRELSVTYKLGPIARVGDWTVGIVGRNIATITKYSGYDPEVGCGGRDGSGCGGGTGAGSTGSGLINQTDAFSFPTLRSWTFSLSTRF